MFFWWSRIKKEVCTYHNRNECRHHVWFYHVCSCFDLFDRCFINGCWCDTSLSSHYLKCRIFDRLTNLMRTIKNNFDYGNMDDQSHWLLDCFRPKMILDINKIHMGAHIRDGDYFFFSIQLNWLVRDFLRFRLIIYMVQLITPQAKRCLSFRLSTLLLSATMKCIPEWKKWLLNF